MLLACGDADRCREYVVDLPEGRVAADRRRYLFDEDDESPDRHASGFISCQHGPKDAGEHLMRAVRAEEVGTYLEDMRKAVDVDLSGVGHSEDPRHQDMMGMLSCKIFPLFLGLEKSMEGADCGEELQDSGGFVRRDDELHDSREDMGALRCGVFGEDSPRPSPDERYRR